MFSNVRSAGHSFKVQCIPFAVICIVFVSCATTSEYGLQKQASSDDRSQPREEYSESGRYLVKNLRSGNADAFNNIVNKEVLLDRAFQEMSPNRHTRKARSQMYANLDEAGMIMAENLGKKAKVTYVRTRRIESEYRVLVRVDMGDRGLSYIEFILQKDDNGIVKVIDWHDYAQGQLYSESLRQALLFMLPRDNSLFSAILGTSWVDQDSVERFSKLAHLAQKNHYKQWLMEYQHLPEKLKYSRLALVTRVLISSAAGAENEYRSALRDVTKHFGDDVSLSLMLVDHYLNERDYAAAHRSLDRLIEYTGGDAAITLLKAKVSLTSKEYLASIKFAKIAIKEDSTLEDAYWLLLAVSVYLNQYNTSVDMLRHLERHFGYVFDPVEIGRMKGYEKFARSPIFADWKYGILP